MKHPKRRRKPTDRFSSEAEKLRALAKEHQAEGRTMAALRVLDRLIDIGQADASTWLTVGQLLMLHREPAQAIGALEQAVAIEPRNAEARHELGRALYKLGGVALASEHLERATELCDKIDPWIALATLAPGNPLYEQADIMKIRKQLASRLANRDRKAVSSRERRPGKPRVGYVSSWFDRPNYMKPVWALINHHDRSQFEIHLFSDTAIDSGFPGYVDHVEDRLHATGGLSNDQLADRIQSESIDLLIDLNAYSTTERLGLFTAPTAPVTAAWFNMYATSGLPGFDYLIGDQATIRPGDQDH
ncbi:MAG: tetratricopeptide repeat protein, partial [Planctomycetota bacterium]